MTLALFQSALSDFERLPLKDAARNLLARLGYESDRYLANASSSPDAFLDEFVQGRNFDQSKALVSEWQSADLLFQLTDHELGRNASLFPDTTVRRGQLSSYVFIAIEMKGSEYPRGRFSDIARQINRLFPMPVMVIFKHADRLTVAVINRRRNKVDDNKDVLERATLIRDINFVQPHRGHLDILVSLALPNLVHPQKKPISDFDTLHAAWEQIFNVELLNARFYRELSNWYFWALRQVEFPADLEPDAEKRRATGLIRLLTRLIFCWFLKEKNLIPEKLFHPTDLAKILKGFDPESETSSTYYLAILQNLFFATLNQRMGDDGNGNPYRLFATDEALATNDVNNLYRYESLFAVSQEDALALFGVIPFLNGGLFECLDRAEDDTGKKSYIDGFSRNVDKRPHVPDRLFFDTGETTDLSSAYGDNKRNAEKVTGLIHILNRYKFTIVENTPIDQEIALDPELLGKVFENLLASYNEETKTTARKQTGSFYTPRPIVDYMVDESLKAHLTRVLVEKARMQEPDARAGLDLLFAYTEKEHAFTPAEVATLIAAIDALKILDPACGSGAFPMGVLHKLVYCLGKLDPDNDRWKQTQLAKLDSAPMRAELDRAFAENNDDYGRKLYLIENCLYGVDIQPIAIQITKLRFFISLVCDQKTNRNKTDSHSIRPLPNLETKFVAADSLVGLPVPQLDMLAWALIDPIEEKIESAVHRHFGAQNRSQKIRLQEEINSLQSELAGAMANALGQGAGSEYARKAKHIATWNRFDAQRSADFFDPHWMFGRSLKEGFDIVIGNPPYVSVERFAGTPMQALWRKRFETYSARADVYCFFYERGADLLRKGGNLTFITSNKWMRAGYGEGLRRFLSSKVNTEAVLDFGMAQNFGAATTYTCITRYVKEEPGGKVMSCYATNDRAAVGDPGGYFAENAVPQENFAVDPWIVLSGVRFRIKKFIEAQGVPLEKWDIQIARGIITGLNDAFYLSADQRDALVAEDPASDELIGRLLRGRDVERYAVNWNETYQLIIKFGAHEYLEDRYPAVFRHLQQFEKQLKERGQCKYGRERKNKDADKRYPGQHHWLELDNNPSDENLKIFAAPKIMYPNMTKFLPFYLDNGGGYLTNDKGFTINSDTQSLCYLTAFLNSHLFRCCFRDNFPELMGNAYEVRKIFMDKIPVKKPTEAEVSLFERLVPLIQFAKANAGSSPGAAAFLEDLIDACMMECYFREHMAERDLLFHDTVAPHLADYAPAASAAQQRDFLTNLHQTLTAPGHPIRDRLDRVNADSPDLLAVIKQEGRV
jgi:adenine-specific DNA-methyltransferase